MVYVSQGRWEWAPGTYEGLKNKHLILERVAFLDLPAGVRYTLKEIPFLKAKGILEGLWS